MAVATISARDGYPRRKRGVVVAVDGGRPRLRTTDGRTVCELNETALALWQLCDGGTSPAEMVDGVCTLFESVLEIVVDDVDRTLREFTDVGLLEWTQAPAPLAEETLA